MFPSSRSLLSTEAIEEERRLFYVASTRAQDQLFLTYPYYSFNGSPENRLQRPSRFLKEIPPDLVEELWIRTENVFYPQISQITQIRKMGWGLGG
jgi:DNA helicase-2/ATP-dependent DNA helicase PcrA